jgi:RNA polymerase sigma-70 factor (ECF subfamily)
MERSTEHVWSVMSDELARFIRRRVESPEVAADLLQETFVRIHDAIDDLRDDDRLAAWVYRIARNVIIDHYRAARRETTLPGDAADPDDNPGIGSAAPDNLNATVGGWLSEMIATLPEPYRATMELAEGEGLTQQAIADRLGLSLSGAKSRVQRGRTLLRRMLLDCCHVELDRYGNVIEVERRRGCPCCRQDEDTA